MDTVIIVGDGAVGTAVSVALSPSRRVILAGPPGTKRGIKRFHAPGAGEAELLHTGIDVVEARGAVVAALKANHIGKAAGYLPGFLEGALICLSNGMGLDGEWGRPDPPVEYAVLTAGFRKDSEFSVSMTPGRLICRKGGSAEALFKGTFFMVDPVENMEAARWAKWYANSIINPLGALSGLPNNGIASSPLARYIEPLGRELAPMMPSEESVIMGKEMLQWLLHNSSNRCSMLQDMENGRETEIDFLTGYLLSSATWERPICRRLVNEIKKLS